MIVQNNMSRFDTNSCDGWQRLFSRTLYFQLSTKEFFLLKVDEDGLDSNLESLTD
jgi:hypothetical protein